MVNTTASFETLKIQPPKKFVYTKFGQERYISRHRLENILFREPETCAITITASGALVEIKHDGKVYSPVYYWS